MSVEVASVFNREGDGSKPFAELACKVCREFASFWRFLLVHVTHVDGLVCLPTTSLDSEGDALMFR